MHIGSPHLQPQLKLEAPSFPETPTIRQKVEHLYADLQGFFLLDQPASLLGWRVRWKKEEPLPSLEPMRDALDTFDQRKIALAPFGTRPLEITDDEHSSPKRVSHAVPLDFPSPEQLPEALDPQPPQRAFDKKASTDDKARIATESFTDLGILLFMRSFLCNIQEQDNSRLIQRIGEMRETHTTPWQLFMREYGKQISWLQWIQCALFYFSCCYIPIGPKTAWAHANCCLQAVRNLFDKDAPLDQRTHVIAEIVDGVESICQAYRDAYQNFATENPRTGKTLANHIQEMLYRLIEEASCERPNHASTSHFSPEVAFHFLIKRPLNGIIRWIMRRWVLPCIFQSIADGWMSTTQRSNIPFFHAINQTLLAKLEQFQQTLQQGTLGDPLPPLPGTEKIESAIKKLLVAMALSPLETLGEIQHKLAEIQQSEMNDMPYLGRKVLEGMEGGGIQAAHALLHYLIDPNHLEDLLGQFFDLLNAKFSEAAPKNDAAWAQKKAEYANTQQKLKAMVRKIFNDFGNKAIRAKIPGGVPPEATEHIAEQAFKGVKTDLQSIAQELCFLSQKVVARVEKEELNDTTHLFPHLIAIAEVLRRFDNEQTLSKELVSVSHAQREGILFALAPLRASGQAMATSLLKLQQDQKQYLYDRTLALAFASIEGQLLIIDKNPAAPQAMQSLQGIGSALDRCRPHFNANKPDNPLPRFDQWARQIQQLLERLSPHQQALDALYRLSPPPKEGSRSPGLLEQLAYFVFQESQGCKPFFSARLSRRKCLDQIIYNVSILTDDEAQRTELFHLIETLNKFHSLPKNPSFDEVWAHLATCLRTHQIERVQAVASYRQQLQTLIGKFQKAVHRSYQEYCNKQAEHLGIPHQHLQDHRDLQGLWKESHRLHAQAQFFKRTVQALQREPQIEIGTETLQNHLQIIGAASALFPCAAAGLVAGGELAKDHLILSSLCSGALELAVDVASFAYPTIRMLRISSSLFAGVYANRQVTYISNNLGTLIENSKDTSTLAYDAYAAAMPSACRWAIVAVATTTFATLSLQYTEDDSQAAVLQTAVLCSAGYLGSTLNQLVPKVVEKGVQDVVNAISGRVTKTFQAAMSFVGNPDIYRAAGHIFMKYVSQAYA